MSTIVFVEVSEPDGRRLWLNAAQIVEIFEAGQDQLAGSRQSWKSVISLSDLRRVYVRETADMIFARIRGGAS